MRADAIACSTNARLGALLARLEIEDPGADFDPLGEDWIQDLFEMAVEAKDPEDEDEEFSDAFDDGGGGFSNLTPF